MFSAVEHGNAECVGWHVCKFGTRFNGLEAVKMGIEEHFGSMEDDVARGLLLRMDHGSQYISDHFRNQIRCWGVAVSWAFVVEPESSGVAERFNRTLEEQAIYGRVFRDAAEVRAAVESFVKRYNNEWLIEKLGFRSPAQHVVTLDWPRLRSAYLCPRTRVRYTGRVQLHGLHNRVGGGKVCEMRFLGCLVCGVLAALVLPVVFAGEAGETVPGTLLEGGFHPRIPERAFGLGLEGTVRVRLSASELGEVQKVEILDSPGTKEDWEEIKETLRQWRFEPALRDGEPVPWSYEADLLFEANWPRELARIYPLKSEFVFSELVALFHELEFKISTRDDANQLLITKELRYKKAGKRFPGLVERVEAGEYTPDRFKIHCIVPKGIEPARIYCNALLIQRRPGGRVAHTGAVEGWILDMLDERLSVSGRTIPTNSARRYALYAELAADMPDSVREWVPNQASLSRMDSEGVTEPELLVETRVSPVYPMDAYTARASGKLIYEVIIQEDGVLRYASLLSGPREHFLDVATRQAIRFWRYTPPRRYTSPLLKGEPVSVFITLVVTYDLE